ncbi:MAG: hypothetical protein Kow00107_01600 [Planctomycetota bacterium]
MKGWFIVYFVVLASVVLLALVYLNQKSVILKQGYEIAKLKCNIVEMVRANHQIVADIQALKRPDRCRSVLGEKMAEFSRPVSPVVPIDPKVQGQSSVASK